MAAVLKNVRYKTPNHEVSDKKQKTSKTTAKHAVKQAKQAFKA
jgi:hypothetical protein